MAHPLAAAAVSAAQAIDVAAGLGRLSPPHPLYRLILFGLAGLCLAVAVLPPLFVNWGLNWERRLYWCGFFAAAVFVALGCLPNWKIGVAFAFLDLVLATGTAYLNGPYIKIRGKVYAFRLQDSEARRGDYYSAPDSYGGLATAQKFWWINVFASAFGVGCLFVVLHGTDRPWFMNLVIASVFVFVPVAIGYGDASGSYPVARGQRVQFAIIAIITLGVVNVVYLMGYAAGRRWPSRFARSMDYGGHARHQRSDDS